MGTFKVCLFFKRALVFPIEMPRVENFKSALPIVTVEFMKKKNEKNKRTHMLGLGLGLGLVE